MFPSKTPWKYIRPIPEIDAYQKCLCSGYEYYPTGPNQTVNSGVNHSSLLTVPLPSAINAYL